MKIKIARTINLFLLIIVLFFITRYLYINLTTLKDYSFNFRLDYFIYSILTVWFWLFTSSYGFHFIMHRIAPNTKFLENLSIWSTSYLGVYIPGKIGVIAFRIMHYSKQGISATKVSYGFFIEMIISLLSTVFIVLLSSIFSGFSFVREYIPGVILLFLALLFLIHPKLISLYARLYYKYIKKTANFHISPYNYWFYFRIIMLQLLKWGFAGFGVFLLINAITPFSWQYLPFVTGLYAIAAVMGTVAFFAPSGLGVVEGVMIFGLKTILSNSLAGLASIFVRIWKIIGELSFVLLVRLALKFAGKDGIEQKQITKTGG